MPGRSFSAENSYRYGFNGRENDNEVKGDGNQQDYGMRVYDPRLGRFLSIDPISKEYPELTPYQFASNRPIEGIDLDGLEIYNATNYLLNIRITYDSKLKKITSGEISINKYKVPEKLRKIIEKGCANETECGGALIATFTQAFKLSTNKPATAQMEDIDAAGPDPVNLPIIPQNKKQARQQVKSGEFTKPVLEGNNSKAGVGIAVIDLTGKLLNKLGDKYLESIVNDAQNQAAQSQLAIGLIQSAIDGGTIPEKYLNSGSLSQVMGYLMSGAPINKGESINGKLEYNTDQQLTNIAKSIWDSYNSEVKAAKEKENVIYERIRTMDNTGKKKSAPFE